MVMKGWINVAYIVKCAVLYCEVTSRTEKSKDKDRAERLFTQNGWTYEPNRGWVCPDVKKRHDYGKGHHQ